MVTPSSRRPALSLTVSSPRVDRTAEREVRPALPWFVVAILGSVGTLALGWMLLAVVVSAAWLTAMRTPLPMALDLAGQGWLAMHFAHVKAGELSVSLVPTGATLLAVAGVAAATHYAGQGLEVADAALRPRLVSLATLVATSAVSYAVGALVLASLVGTAPQATAAFVGASGMAVTGALVGGVLAVFPDLADFVPRWLRPLPGALGVGLGVLAGGSASALAVGLALRWDQAQALQRALAPDLLGQVLLVSVYLAYLPTLLTWSGSYVLGAGLTLGTGTVVTPGETTLGLLPAFPPLAAVPEAGSPLAWGWLGVGLVAGAASGAWFCRGDLACGGTPRWDRWTWQAALPGLGAALVWLAASWLSRGDLGQTRLVGMGPIFPDLLWWTTVPLTAGAAASGLVLALLGARRGASEPDADPTPVGAGASVPRGSIG